MVITSLYGGPNLSDECVKHQTQGHRYYHDIYIYIYVYH